MGKNYEGLTKYDFLVADIDKELRKSTSGRAVHAFFVYLVENDGFVTTSDVMEEFDVGIATVYKWRSYLIKKGLVKAKIGTPLTVDNKKQVSTENLSEVAVQEKPSEEAMKMANLFLHHKRQFDSGFELTRTNVFLTAFAKVVDKINTGKKRSFEDIECCILKLLGDKFHGARFVNGKYLEKYFNEGMGLKERIGTMEAVGDDYGCRY